MASGIFTFADCLQNGEGNYKGKTDLGDTFTLATEDPVGSKV